jgi:hypothetical protein
VRFEVANRMWWRTRRAKWLTRINVANKTASDMGQGYCGLIRHAWLTESAEGPPSRSKAALTLENVENLFESANAS